MRCFLPVSLSVFLLAACATPQPPRMANVWRDAAAPAGVPCKRVLVMGYGDDGAQRRIFEDVMVDMIGRTGAAAVPSYTQHPVPDKDFGDATKLMRAAKTDCLLSSKLLRTESRQEIIEWPATPYAGYGWGRRYGYGYGMNSMWYSPPPTVRNYSVMVLETSLRRDGRDGIVWSGGREMLLSSDPAPGARVYSEAVARGLREAGWL